MLCLTCLKKDHEMFIEKHSTERSLGDQKKKKCNSLKSTPRKKKKKGTYSINVGFCFFNFCPHKKFSKLNIHT